MKENKTVPYLFMLPALIIYLSVIIFPVFYSLWISFQSGTGIGSMDFVGLKNYTKLIHDEVLDVVQAYDHLDRTYGFRYYDGIPDAGCFNESEVQRKNVFSCVFLFPKRHLCNCGSDHLEVDL